MTLHQLEMVLKAQNEAMWKAVCYDPNMKKKIPYEDGLAPLVATCLGQELVLKQRHINKRNRYNQIVGVCDCVPTLVYIKSVNVCLALVLAENVNRRPQRG